MDIKEIIQDHIYLDASRLIYDCINTGLLPVPEEEFAKAYFISDWLYAQLKNKKEEVMDSTYGYIWFRKGYGYGLEYEIVLQSIAKEE